MVALHELFRPIVRLMRRVAAIASWGGPALAAASVLALHALVRDHDPVRQRLSEYATAPFGWLLTLAFAAVAVGLAGLGVTLAQRERSNGMRRLVIALAAVGAAGMALSALNPVGGPHEAVHSAASTVAALAVTALAVLWSFAGAWSSPAARLIAVAAGLLLAVSPILHDTGVTGLGQRLLWLVLLGWVLLVAGDRASQG